MLLLLLGGGTSSPAPPPAKIVSRCCFSPTAFQRNAFQNCGGIGSVGRLQHDPEDLERRLRAQKESVFNPKWLDRFLAAEEKARRRIDKVKSAKHRAALEEAVEQAAARVGEAIDAGTAAPEQLIIELEAAANAVRATASLKHALIAIEMARAILMEDEEALLLLM